MKNKLLALVLSSGVAFPAVAALQPGQVAPPFKAQASFQGKAFEYSLANALKKGAVVVYFYPSAYTGGCNIQAHTFAVNQEKFAAAGATIIGVSLDDIGRLNDFSADPDFCAGKFPTAADPEGNIAKSYELNIRDVRAGAKDTRGQDINHAFAERTTFVVTADGKIAATIGGVQAEDNVNQTLAFVQGLNGHQAAKP
jgi:peroxiredoxin